MSKVYFGFALADSMFSGDVQIQRRVLTVEEAHQIIDKGVVSCLNPSHITTIAAMQLRYNFTVDIPEKPPHVTLSHGDAIVVMGVRGLPRLTDKREYTEQEILIAAFNFTLYTVLTDVIYN